MNDATFVVSKVKKEHPEAKGKEFQTLVGKEYIEIRVKHLMEQGLSFEDIAKELNIAESTVRRVAAKV